MTPNTNPKIWCEWNGKAIKGKIIYRSPHGLKVEITSPYVGWTESTSINGFHKMSPNHFLTPYGDIRAKEMLVDCFRKMRLIDEKWPAILSMFNSLTKLINGLGITDAGKRDDIIKSVIEEQWEEWIFDERETGLMLSVGQEGQLLDIIQKKLSASPE